MLLIATKNDQLQRHPSLKVEYSVPVQHLLYMHYVVPSSQATQCRIGTARFMQLMYRMARLKWETVIVSDKIATPDLQRYNSNLNLIKNEEATAVFLTRKRLGKRLGKRIHPN